MFIKYYKNIIFEGLGNNNIRIEKVYLKYIATIIQNCFVSFSIFDLEKKEKKY
jgi:hypothetical protein